MTVLLKDICGNIEFDDSGDFPCYTIKEPSFIKLINKEDIAPRVDIKVKYLPGAARMEMTEVGDWCDMYTYEETVLKEGERTYINLGFACQLPEGCEAIMAPRSSTYKRWGILQTNSIGVIDSSYCGNDDIWMFPALAMRDVTIPAGTRICQFRIQEKQPKLNFVEVDDLHNENRNGLGSTGA